MAQKQEKIRMSEIAPKPGKNLRMSEMAPKIGKN